jgi:hypothetical protein
MMRRAFSFSPYQQDASVAGNKLTPKGIADFLLAHDKMASLMPTVMRLAALEKDCAALLPDMFNTCAVLQFNDANLLLSAQNAGLAAKLKQQLPKLQAGLVKRGWQVNAIRLKVQVVKNVEKSKASKQLLMPSQALSAWSELENTLEESVRNASLKAALGALVARHRDKK